MEIPKIFLGVNMIELRSLDITIMVKHVYECVCVCVGVCVCVYGSMCVSVVIEQRSRARP